MSRSAGVDGAFAWSFTRNDKKRVRLRGAGVRFNEVRGLDCRAHKLTGLPVSYKDVQWPIVDPSKTFDDWDGSTKETLTHSFLFFHHRHAGRFPKASCPNHLQTQIAP